MIGACWALAWTGRLALDRFPAIQSPAAALVFLVVQMTFIPCIATVAAIKQETGTWKWPVFSVGLLVIVSLGSATIVYQLAKLLGWGS